MEEGSRKSRMDNRDESRIFQRWGRGSRISQGRARVLGGRSVFQRGDCHLGGSMGSEAQRDDTDGDVSGISNAGSPPPSGSSVRCTVSCIGTW